MGAATKGYVWDKQVIQFRNKTEKSMGWAASLQREIELKFQAGNLSPVQT